MSSTENLITRIDSLELTVKEMQKVLNELTGAGMKKKASTKSSTATATATANTNETGTDANADKPKKSSSAAPKKTKTAGASATTATTKTESTAAKPHLEFGKLWKDTNSAFRQTILDAFPDVQKAIDNDDKVKAELKPSGKINKEQLLVWKMCKPDKKNDEKLTKFVADLMKKSGEGTGEVQQLEKEE